MSDGAEVQQLRRPTFLAADNGNRCPEIRRSLVM